jgi:hypothetical protein
MAAGRGPDDRRLTSTPEARQAGGCGPVVPGDDLTMARRRQRYRRRWVCLGQEVVRMMLQPDESHPGRSPGHDRGNQERLAGAPADAAANRDLHESIWSAEPVWVMPSIVLGFVALTGSVLLFAVLTIIGIILWLLNTPPIEQNREIFGQPWPGPFGGPGLPL